MKQSVGFIGLGIMGKPMALNLLKAGVNLLVHDINIEAVQELENNGALPATLSEIGKKCETVFTILPDGNTVKNVLFSENGVAPFLSPGSTVCDMSSVSPVEARDCAEHLEKLGVGFVDAPVSGGEPKAIDGTLAFMAGGNRRCYEKLESYFEIMGSSAILVGDTGSGCITKLANQMIVNLTIAAVSEAFVFASKAGADPEMVYKAIRGGLAGSAVLDAKLPMIMERNFKPGGKISINHKDIKNVLATAHYIDVPVPLSGSLFEIMQSLKVWGHLEDDHCGIVHYFEKLADAKVEKNQSK